MTEGPSITCPVCHLTSYNPNDVSEGYCGNCHDWTGAIAALVEAAYMFWSPRSTNGARPMHWDRQGHPITFPRWSWLYEPRFGNPHLSYTSLADEDPVEGVRVSTVWMGTSIPGSIMDPPMPLEIFETALFLDDQLVSTGRWNTEAEALAEHRILVNSVTLVGRSFVEDLARDNADSLERHIAVLDRLRDDAQDAGDGVHLGGEPAGQLEAGVVVEGNSEE